MGAVRWPMAFGLLISACLISACCSNLDIMFPSHVSTSGSFPLTFAFREDPSLLAVHFYSDTSQVEFDMGDSAQALNSAERAHARRRPRHNPMHKNSGKYHAKARFPDSSLLTRKTIDEEMILLSESRRVQQTILKGFWKRFKQEYLQHLSDEIFQCFVQLRVEFGELAGQRCRMNQQL